MYNTEAVGYDGIIIILILDRW